MLARGSIVLTAAGGLSIGLVTFVSHLLQADVATVVLLYALVIVIVSLGSTLAGAIGVSVLAVACLDYFFTPPLYHFRISETTDLVAMVAFATMAIVITRLMNEVRGSLRGMQKEVEERSRAENALREQASLLDLTHDALVVRGKNDAIVYWNRGAEELYGWTSAQALGNITHEFLNTVFPVPLEEIDRVVSDSGKWEGELVHSTRDGRQITVASRWSLQHDGQGRRIGTLETNNDITNHKRAEEAARKAQTDLAHASRMMTMGELAASIAHEVNQPLSGVVLNANASLRWLAAQPPDLEEAREAIRRIIRDGKRASDVIARVRTLSKKASTEKERMDLNKAILEVTSLAQREIAKSRVIVSIALETNLPPVIGDRVQLQQVVLNLILNAVESMSAVGDRPRQLVISTCRDDGQRVRVAVKDSGVGLDPDHANQIFDAFYTTKRGGIGMGLSISRTIVESHGGKLWAVPNDGPGATFQFTV